MGSLGGCRQMCLQHHSTEVSSMCHSRMISKCWGDNRSMGTRILVDGGPSRSYGQGVAERWAGLDWPWSRNETCSPFLQRNRRREILEWTQADTWIIIQKTMQIPNFFFLLYITKLYWINLLQQKYKQSPKLRICLSFLCLVNCHTIVDTLNIHPT